MGRLKTAPAWDREKFFFSVPDMLTFAVKTKMAPQFVESPFYEGLIELARRDFPNKHILQPRGTAKTGRVNALIAFLLSHPDLQIWGPSIRVACVGETMEMSQRNLAKVRTTLETNEHILKTVGNLAPTRRLMREVGIQAKPMWTDTMFQTAFFIRSLRSSGYTPEDPSCIALSMNKATTGRRYDVILLDDPVGTESGRSSVKRAKAREVFQECQRQQATNSLQIILGTRHHEEDIHWSIETEFGEDFLFDAIDIWGGAGGQEKLWRSDFEKDGGGFWRLKRPLAETELFWSGFGQLEIDVPAGGFPADDDERKRRALHHLRVKMGGMSPGDWAKNYLNACLASHDRVFNEGMFREYSQEGFDPSKVLNYLLTDAAEGKDFRSSWRVVAVVSVDHLDVAHVREVDYGVWTPAEYGRRMVEQYYRYGCKRLLVERMAWTQTVRAVLDLTCAIEGKPIPRIVEVPGRSVSSKRSRIEALEPRMSSGMMLFSPHLKHKVGPNGRTVWQEIVTEFMSVQDLDTMPRLKVDIADALSDVDSTDDEDQRICRPPRIYTRSGESVHLATTPPGKKRSIVGSGFGGRRSLLG